MIISLANFFKYIFYSSSKKKFTIYSEGIFYKNYYYKLAKELNKQNELVIVTSDKKEFNLLKNIFSVFLIENLLIRFLFFTFVNCKFLIMTMNDIGNNYTKSKFCENYVYFFHSLASTHAIYNEKAYDNFDIIFVNGKYQSDEIKYREKIKNLKSKKIVNTGYFFLNYLRKKDNPEKVNNMVLFAPSWSKSNKNLFNDLSDEIIDTLIKSDKFTVFRPHPESIKRNFSKFNNIKKKYSSVDNFKIDLSEDNIYINKCKFLITDNSTIAMEFSLLNYLPSIYFNYEPKVHNINFKDIPIDPYENVFKKKFGIEINNVDDLNDLDNLVKNFLTLNTSYNDQLKLFEKETLYDYEKSIDIACNFLQKS